MSFVYQPTDPSFAEQAHSIYRRLRDEFPVWADPQGRFHALSRFTDVLEATKDWETFSSTGKLEAVYSKPTMNSFDPPRHTQLRALISRAFTPRRVSDLEPSIRAMAVGLLEDFLPDGRAEAIAQYAALLQAEIDGERLSEDELLAFGWLLLVGGNDTTTNLIGNGIELFARHPDARRQLAQAPARIAPAVDELLRRIPDYALLEKPEHFVSSTFYGWEHLQIGF